MTLLRVEASHTRPLLCDDLHDHRLLVVGRQSDLLQLLIQLLNLLFVLQFQLLQIFNILLDRLGVVLYLVPELLQLLSSLAHEVIDRFRKVVLLPLDLVDQVRQQEATELFAGIVRNFLRLLQGGISRLTQ